MNVLAGEVAEAQPLAAPDPAARIDRQPLLGKDAAHGFGAHGAGAHGGRVFSYERARTGFPYPKTTRTGHRRPTRRQDKRRSAFRSSSLRIATPAACAFAAFDPGLSPTITPVVFFETESETFAPSASSASFASSRVNALERARQHVLAAGQRPLDSTVALIRLEPQSKPAQLVQEVPVLLVGNHSEIDSARSPPIPSTRSALPATPRAGGRPTQNGARGSAR